MLKIELASRESRGSVESPHELIYYASLDGQVLVVAGITL